MKKFTSIILVLALICICFVSCGTHPAATALDEVLAYIKSGDFANAEVLADSPFSSEDDEMLKAMYKNFDYTVGDVTETDGGVAVALNVTTTNLGEVFMNYMSEVLASELDEESLFIEMLNREDAPVAEFDISVNMVETDGKWTVAEDNETFFDALTGGLFSSLGGLTAE